MKIHKFTFKDGREIYGFVSLLNIAEETVAVLKIDEPGMIGKDGTIYSWNDFQAVYSEGSRDGVYDSDEQVGAWRRYSRAPTGR